MGPLWGRCGVAVGPLWDRYGVLKGSLWGRYGAVMGSLWGGCGAAHLDGDGQQFPRRADPQQTQWGGHVLLLPPYAAHRETLQDPIVGNEQPAGQRDPKRK